MSIPAFSAPKFSARRDLNELHVKAMPGYSSAAGADNTTAFQAACTEAMGGITGVPTGDTIANGYPAGRTVVLPPGRTFIDPTTITHVKNATLPFNIRGTGAFPSSSASWLCRNPGTGSSNALLKIVGGTGTYQWGSEIRDVFFYDPTTQGADGLHIQHATHMRVARCVFMRLAKAIRLNDAFTNIFEQCKVEKCAHGAYGETNTNHNSFNDCSFHECTTAGFQLATSCLSHDLVNPDIENCAIGVVLGATDADIKIRGGWFESNTIAADINTGRIKFDGTFFVPGGAVDLAAGTTGLFEFCRGYTAQSITGAGTSVLTNCVNL